MWVVDWMWWCDMSTFTITLGSKQSCFFTCLGTPHASTTTVEVNFSQPSCSSLCGLCCSCWQAPFCVPWQRAALVLLLRLTAGETFVQPRLSEREGLPKKHVGIGGLVSPCPEFKAACPTIGSSSRPQAPLFPTLTQQQQQISHT